DARRIPAGSPRRRSRPCIWDRTKPSRWVRSSPLRRRAGASSWMPWAWPGPCVSSLCRPRSGRRARLAGEPDLQPVFHEAGLLHLQSLESLGKHEVALVAPDANEQLVGLAEDFDLGLLGERQPEREHVRSPP